MIMMTEEVEMAVTDSMVLFYEEGRWQKLPEKN